MACEGAHLSFRPRRAASPPSGEILRVSVSVTNAFLFKGEGRPVLSPRVAQTICGGRFIGNIAYYAKKTTDHEKQFEKGTVLYYNISDKNILYYQKKGG